MGYEEMLERGVKNLPDAAITKAERFEIPKVAGHLEGNKTIISNFAKIADALGRGAEQVLKYVLKELAAPGELRGNLLVIGTKVPASKINQKIRRFAIEYVLCEDCGKPDTKLIKEGNIMYKKCMACGEKRAIKL